MEVQAITSPKELMAQELAAIYSAERIMLKGMSAMEKRAHHAQVKNFLESHRKDTEDQIHQLEEAFHEIGQEPREVPNPVADALVADFNTMAEQVQDPNLIDMVILGVLNKNEHVETSAYRGLLDKALLMGQCRLARIFGQIAVEEESGAFLSEKLANELGQELVASRSVQ